MIKEIEENTTILEHLQETGECNIDNMDYNLETLIQALEMITGHEWEIISKSNGLTIVSY